MSLTCSRCHTSVALNPKLQVVKNTLQFVGGSNSSSSSSSSINSGPWPSASTGPDSAATGESRRCDHLLCVSCLDHLLAASTVRGGANCPVKDCNGFWKKHNTELMVPPRAGAGAAAAAAGAAGAAARSAPAPSSSAMAAYNVDMKALTTASGQSFDGHFDTEMKIRREVMNRYYRRRENFAADAEGDDAYNAYLEDVEDMVQSKMANINVAAVDEKIRKYESTQEARRNLELRKQDEQDRLYRVKAELQEREEKRRRCALADEHEVDEVRLYHAQHDALLGGALAAQYARLTLRKGARADALPSAAAAAQQQLTLPMVLVQALQNLPQQTVKQPTRKPPSAFSSEQKRLQASAGGWSDALAIEKAKAEALAAFH